MHAPMARTKRGNLASLLVIAAIACSAADAIAQEETGSASVMRISGEPPMTIPLPAPTLEDKPFPVNLPTALQLANVRPIDIAVASERIRLAVAQLERAKALWL